MACRQTESILADLDVSDTPDVIQPIHADKLNRPAVIFACLPEAKGATAELVIGAEFSSINLNGGGR